MFRFIPRKKGEGEKGQALILVLVLLTLVCLIIPPLLGFMGTGSKSGAVYQEKTSELYAADAGIQDATWLIKYNHFSELGGYSPYLLELRYSSSK
jgi:Tfp pilus assembly protein PilX